MDSQRKQSKKRKRKQVEKQQEDSAETEVEGIVERSSESRGKSSKKSSKSDRKRQKLNNTPTSSTSGTSTSREAQVSTSSTSNQVSGTALENQTFQRLQQQKLLKKSKKAYKKKRVFKSSRNQSTSRDTNQLLTEDEEMSDQHSAFENLLNSLGGYGYMAARAKLSDERVEQLLEDLKEESGEGRNFDAVSELCNFYSISTEQSLTSSRMTEFVPHLINMLQKDHNYDLMLLAARALTNMVDAMPAAGSSVVREGALPIFTEKLLNIEFIDLAEQCIQCLYILSNDQSSSLLREGILMASLTFIDFFSIDLQRKIAAMAANMCRKIPQNLFSNVECAIPNITFFLQSADPRIVESGCKCFQRIVSCFPNDSNKIDLICSSNMLDNCLALLSSTTTNKATLSSALHLLAVASHGSFAVFKQLHEKGVAIMLSTMLGHGNDESDENASRTVREHLSEILHLLLELLPSRNEKSKFITEMSAANRKSLFQIIATPQQYLKDVTVTSEEINEQKKRMFVENPQLLISFGECMLPVLIEMFRSTHAEVVANRCLTVVGTVLHFSSADILKEMLLNIPFSTFLSSLLTSNRLVQVATAVQFAEILLEKLPEIFTTYIVREGVFHQLKKISGREVNDKRVKLLLDVMKEKVKKAYQKAEKQKVEQEAKKRKDLEQKKKEQREKGETETDETITVTLVVPKVKAPEIPPNSSLSPQKCDYSTLTTSELAPYIVASAQLFQQKFFSNEKSLDSVVVSKLKDLSADLRAFVESPDESDEESTLEKLREVIVSDEGVSNFEVITSGIIASLVTYLTALSSSSNGTHQERLQRVFRFCKVFDAKISDKSDNRRRLSGSPSFRGSFGSPSMRNLKSTEHTYLLELVRKIQLCLTSVENFNLIVNENQTLLHNIASTINSLSKPLKIKLTKISGTKKKVFEVAVSPLAEVDAIIQYLNQKPKKKTKDANESNDEEKEESNEEESVNVASSTTSYFEVEEEEDEDHRTQTNSVEISAETTSNDKYLFLDSSEPESAKKQTTPEITYRLYMGGEPLDPHSTIFQVLYSANRKTSGSVQHPSTMKLWEATHLMEYDKGAPLVIEKEVPQPADEWISVKKSSRGKHKSKKAEKSSSRSVFSKIIEYPMPGKDTEATAELKEHTLIELFNQLLDSSFSSVFTVKNVDEDVSGCLDLLRIINFLNLQTENLSHIEKIPDQPTKNMISSKEFINSKLSSKLIRQLQDPYILFTRCLPEWTTQLASSCGFLFSYETRKLFFHLHFGIARAIKKIQERQLRNENNSNVRRNNERFVRIERQKIKLIREPNFLESSFKVMENYAATKAILEFQYEGEEGTGLGPTLEFYTLVSAEMQKAGLGIWRDEYTNDEDANDPYHDRMVAAKSGLFPRPVDPTKDTARVERIFRFLGMFVARALYDDRIVDLPFSNPLYKAIQGRKLVYTDIKEIDPILFKQLESLKALVQAKHKIEATVSNKAECKKQIESLTLNNDGMTTIDLLYQVFVLPGYPDIELIENGKDVDVTIWNLEEYVEQVCEFILRRGVECQISAFRKGFSQVLSNSSMLNLFSYAEMDDMICGCEEKWTVPYLTENTLCDHGYSSSSRAVQFFFNILSEMTSTEQRLFLKFVTGCAKLPSGGLKALSPKMTIVLKPVPSDSNLTPDTYLPSVMTCANFIKLPNYSSEQIMKIQLFKAIEMGQNSFLLS